MIKIISGIWLLLKNLFTSGGLISKILTLGIGWVSSLFAFFGLFATAVVTLLTGGLKMIYTIWGIVSAYTLVETFRRFLLVGFIASFFSWLLNYFFEHVIIYDQKSLSQNFSDLIISIDRLGQWGHFILAFLSHIGIFDGMGIFLTVMVYTLFARVALSILFR